MMYLDIIMTDKENCNDIVPIIDHKAFLLKDIIKKPKVSLWDLYKLKKYLETGYERLTNEVQDSVKCAGQKVDSPRTYTTKSTSKSKN